MTTNTQPTHTLPLVKVEEVKVEVEEEECFKCHLKYVEHDKFCNDCGTDYCLDCLNYSNGRELEYMNYLCYECDEQREAEEAVNQPQQG